MSVAGAVLIFLARYTEIYETEELRRLGHRLLLLSEPGCYLLSYVGCWVRSRCSTSRGRKLWPRCPMPLCTSINVES
jgi:hypothetical protein